MKVLYLARFADATSYFRCELPVKYLKEYGVETRFDYVQEIPQIPGSGIKESDVKWADVIVFQRPINTFEVECIKKIKEACPEKVVVGEYDDNYRDVPRWNPGFTYLKAKEKEWVQCVPLYDGITVTTPALKKLMVELDAKCPIEIIKNALDVEAIEESNNLEAHEIISPGLDDDLKDTINFKITIEQFNKYTENKRVIAWFGSRSHYGDLDWIPEDLSRISKDFPDTVFLFIGYTHWKMMLSLPPERHFFCMGRFPVIDYYRLLKSLKIDIALMPINPNQFNLGKSNIKCLEAMQLGMIPVASLFDTYDSDPFYGFHADYKYGDWYESISKALDLIGTETHQEYLRNNKMIVKNHYNMRVRAKEFISFYERLIREKNA